VLMVAASRRNSCAAHQRWLPMFLFAIVFGLYYHMFLPNRIKILVPGRIGLGLSTRQFFRPKTPRFKQPGRKCVNKTSTCSVIFASYVFPGYRRHLTYRL